MPESTNPLCLTRGPVRIEWLQLVIWLIVCHRSPTLLIFAHVISFQFVWSELDYCQTDAIENWAIDPRRGKTTFTQSSSDQSILIHESPLPEHNINGIMEWKRISQLCSRDHRSALSHFKRGICEAPVSKFNLIRAKILTRFHLYRPKTKDKSVKNILKKQPQSTDLRQNAQCRRKEPLRVIWNVHHLSFTLIF